MATVKVLGNGTDGLFVQMQSGAIGSTAQPVHRQNLACTPFTAREERRRHRRRQGDRHREVHHQQHRPGLPQREPPGDVPDQRRREHAGHLQLPSAGHATTRIATRSSSTTPATWFRCRTRSGATKKQVVIMQKTNDDCDHASVVEGAGEVVSDAAGSTHIVYWAGCNGNGRDDGWVNDIQVTVGERRRGVQDRQELRRRRRAAGRAFARHAARVGTDPNTAICSWTAGNNQPQREGTWVGAIDMSPTGPKGENANSRLLWKKRIQDQTVISGVRTYSVRANSARILDATGAPRPIRLWSRPRCLRGNNTNDNGKGGRYLAMFMGVATATKTGLDLGHPAHRHDQPDARHRRDAPLARRSRSCRTSSRKMLPAMTFLQGSQNGGGVDSGRLKILARRLGRQEVRRLRLAEGGRLRMTATCTRTTSATTPVTRAVTSLARSSSRTRSPRRRRIRSSSCCTPSPARIRRTS